MKLSQLFTGNLHTEDTVGTEQPRSARNVADINRQIRSLIPGQTIRGEILSRNGSELQLRLTEDLILNARVDQNIHLEQGQNVTFEVKNNGRTLSLSPLFTNVAADINVLKALEMAGLPVNQRTVAMTKQLMEGGLSVNKSFLQQVYREINSFPEGEISDIVGLHELEIPVNSDNVQQMITYRNQNHRLINGLTDILDEMPVAIDNMFITGDAQNVNSIYRQLFQIITETEEFLPETGAAENVGEVTTEFTGQIPIPEEMRMTLADNLSRTIERLQLSPEESAPFLEKIQPIEQGEISRTEFFDIVRNLLELSGKNREDTAPLQRLLGSKEFRSMLTEQLKDLWTLKPDEVSQPEKVENLYRRLDRQMKGLAKVLESAGQQETTVYRSVTNVTKNVDFLNQLNQLYTYVQLPLRLQQSEAHGDLYVYTNKRSLAENDGKVSALLHLDMENLGALDVYVTLEKEKVSTKFNVADEEVLSFLEAHMNMLTKRLEKRGYECSCSVSIKETGEEEKESIGGLVTLLGQERGNLISQYAFDVRT